MWNYLKPLIFFILALAVFMFASMARAETENQKTLSPYFFIENGDPSVDRFPLKKTHNGGRSCRKCLTINRKYEKLQKMVSKLE